LENRARGAVQDAAFGIFDLNLPIGEQEFRERQRQFDPRDTERFACHRDHVGHILARRGIPATNFLSYRLRNRPQQQY